MDWEAAGAWVDALPDDAARRAAWDDLERAWLAHLRSALGPDYRLRDTDDAMLLSTLDPGLADATLAFMAKTLRRIVHVLEGIGRPPHEGKSILVLMDDADTYYRYVARHYDTGGEFAFSGGMYIDDGCGHFLSVKSDVRSLEAVIAHEMTHACVGHLPIPAWVNEGIAVSTEQRLVAPGPALFTPREMHAKHRAFWDDARIQEFWSGASFLRADDGSMLSYDLARILVTEMSADWPTFRTFVLAADLADAGAAAAAEFLGIDLGAAACALVERAPDAAWSPNPAAWAQPPQPGASRESPR